MLRELEAAARQAALRWLGAAPPVGAWTPRAPAYVPEPYPAQRTGPWLLYVPRETGTTAEVGPGAATSMAQIGLIPSAICSSPQKLEEWRLRSVQLPCSLSCTTAAAPAQTLVATVIAQLRRQGEVVWTQPLEIPMTPTLAAETAFTSNFTFSEALPLEIAVRTGQSLELDVVVAFNLKVKTSELLVSGWKAGAAAAAPVTATQGAFEYWTVHWTGRVEL